MRLSTCLASVLGRRPFVNFGELLSFMGRSVVYTSQHMVLTWTVECRSESSLLPASRNGGIHHGIIFSEIYCFNMFTPYSSTNTVVENGIMKVQKEL